jgi:hypothetical protein
VLCEVAAVLVRPSERRGDAIHVPDEPEHLAGVGAAQPDGVVEHRLKHGAERGRASDRLQDLARRRLLLDRVGEISGQLLDALFEL